MREVKRYEHNEKRLQKIIASNADSLRRKRNYKNPRSLARAISIVDKTRGLDAVYKAVLKIVNPDDYALDSDWIPPVTDLLWMCEALDCDVNYLLGAIGRPDQLHHDVGSYIGLSDKAIDTLHERYESKKKPTESATVDTAVEDFPFLDFFIASDSSIRLLSVLAFERNNRQTIQRIKKNKKHYRIVKTAFDKALSAFGLSDADGFYQLSPWAKSEEMLEGFTSNLYTDLKLFGADPDDGFRFEDETPKVNSVLAEWYGMTVAQLLDALLFDYESLETERKIEKAFMNIVHEYFDKGVK